MAQTHSAGRDAPTIAVATMTLARSAGEADQLQRGLTALSRHGCPVIVSDGGSLPEFVATLAVIPGVVLTPPTDADLLGQIEATLAGACATGAAHVLYTEPDKAAFFEHHLATFLADCDLRDDHLWIAARSSESYHTYPPHQRATESAINAECATVLGRDGDYSYGPFLMPRRLAQRVTALPRDLGWGWRHFAFGLAHRLGYSLRLVEGPFTCPPDQRTEDGRDRAHRDQQLAQNQRGLFLSASSRIPDP